MHSRMIKQMFCYKQQKSREKSDVWFPPTKVQRRLNICVSHDNTIKEIYKIIEIPLILLHCLLKTPLQDPVLLQHLGAILHKETVKRYWLYVIIL